MRAQQNILAESTGVFRLLKENEFCFEIWDSQNSQSDLSQIWVRTESEGYPYLIFHSLIVIGGHKYWLSGNATSSINFTGIGKFGFFL